MHFEALVKKIDPTLKRITHKLNGHFTFFNEDDLYQEAVLHLWMEFKAGKVADKTESYILQGCFFHLKNHIRMVRDKARFLSLEEPSAEWGEFELESKFPVEDAGKTYDRINAKLLAETLLNNGFSPKEKSLLRLLCQDLTVREIGQRMGISHVMVLKMQAKLKGKCRKYRDRP